MLTGRQRRFRVALISASVGLLVTCTMTLAQGPMGVDSPRPSGSCASSRDRKQAENAFREGVKAFESEHYQEAVHLMLKALAYGCSQVRSVHAAYGRWAYAYEPDLYLGLALHRLGACLAHCTRCLGEDEERWRGTDIERWWRTEVVNRGIQDQCERALASLETSPAPSQRADGCRDGHCFTIVESSDRYCPVIDWRKRVEVSSGDLALQELTHHDCRSVDTLEGLLVRIFTFGKSKAARSSDLVVCKEIVAELARVHEACR